MPPDEGCQARREISWQNALLEALAMVGGNDEELSETEENPMIGPEPSVLLLLKQCDWKVYLPQAERDKFNLDFLILGLGKFNLNWQVCPLSGPVCDEEMERHEMVLHLMCHQELLELLNKDAPEDHNEYHCPEGCLAWFGM